MARSCTQSLLKMVYSVMGMVGIALAVYGLWMFNVWQPHLSAPNAAVHRGTMNSPASGSAAIRNQTDVSFFLAKRVISTLPIDANVVFSPVSIQAVLGLIASGSKGPTLDELLRFFNSQAIEDVHSLLSQLNSLLKNADGCGPRFTFTNGVFVDHSLSLNPIFKQIVANAYKASIRHLDFQTKAFEATKEANLWAEKETNGLIKELLPPGSVDTNTSARLLLANAVYFKGTWDEKFDESKTRDDQFFLLNGGSVQVPFITSNNEQYVRAFDGFKVLRLPYRRGRKDKRKFSMYFFLPDSIDGLPALVEKVCSESGFLDRHIPYRKVEVGSFLFPKFKVSFQLEASNVLKGLGVALPFHPGGLTDIVDSPIISREIYVSQVFHKSFVEINEEGTEAAAATAAIMVNSALGVETPKLDFVANHPFLFVVREDTTGVVLFIGQIHSPIHV